MYFVYYPFFIYHGILYNDLPDHYSGAHLEQL